MPFVLLLFLQLRLIVALFTYILEPNSRVNVILASRMKKNNVVQESLPLSIEKIIELIRERRDHSISNLLKKESLLLSFLETHYDIIALSAIKMEFLRRTLRELRDTSLDLVHYASLIRQMKESNATTIDEKHALFLQELKATFEKGSIVRKD